MMGASQFHSPRHRVAKTLYLGPSLLTQISQTPWEELSRERQSGWLSDADMIIPIVIEACARVADQRDPEKPDNYLFKREQIGSVIKGLFVGHPDDEDVWECPISHPDCTQNCGSYGCGN